MPLRHTRLAGLMAAVALSLPLVPLPTTTAAAANNLASDAATAVVTGRVVNPEGVPLAGVEITVSPHPSGLVTSATTDANGAFTSPAVEPGTYRVTARDSGEFLEGGSTYRAESWNGTASAPGSSTVDLPPGTTTTHFELDYLIGIVATAVDADTGAPLPNIGWNAHTLDPLTGTWKSLGRDAQPTFPSGKTFYPTDDGQVVKFCFLDIYYPDGWTPPYRYQQSCWQGKSSFETATPITTPAATRKLDITIPMKRAGLSMTQGRPFVHGNTSVGSSLTVEPGQWGPEPVALSYQWGYFDEGVHHDIPGASSPTLRLTSDLVGKQVDVNVTGAKDGYATSTAWASRGVVGVRTPTVSAFTLTGATTAGSVLTASLGTLTPSDSFTEFTWYADGTKIPGAHASTYTVTAATAGKAIGVAVRIYAWTDPATTSEEKNELLLFRFRPGIITAATPSVSGTPGVGSTLTANAGSWHPLATDLTYQWKRAGVSIPGATSRLYVPTDADAGKALTVSVTGSRYHYTSVTRTSAPVLIPLPTPTVIGGTVALISPTFPRVGDVLGVDTSGWGPGPVTLTYQWYRGSTLVPGGTTPFFILKPSDNNHQFKVVVTGSAAGHESTSVASRLSRRVGTSGVILPPVDPT